MRLKLTIAYDGRPFRGWQSQASGDTVQDHLERAFAQLEGQPVGVHGSGRTDTGVHALGQIAHVDVDRALTPHGWLRALNAHLPPEIRVIKVTRPPADFHARFDATGKMYRYRLWRGEFQHPLELGRAWQVPVDLDLALLREGAELLTGTHDFRGFAANRGKPHEDTVRTIKSIRIAERGECLELTFTGDGFLYKMVRLLTGSLVRVALGKRDLPWLKSVVEGTEKSSFAAPAEGLYLVRVFY